MHLSPAHIAAFQGAAPADSAIESDIASGGKVLDELFASEIIVIGAPMYNFTIPSQLKACIDRIVVRVGPEQREKAMQGAFQTATMLRAA